MTIFNCTTFTLISRLHLGQNNGKFNRTVSGYTFVFVFPLQNGHLIQRVSFLSSIWYTSPSFHKWNILIHPLILAHRSTKAKVIKCFLQKRHRTDWIHRSNQKCALRIWRRNLYRSLIHVIMYWPSDTAITEPSEIDVVVLKTATVKAPLIFLLPSSQARYSAKHPHKNALFIMAGQRSANSIQALWNQSHTSYSPHNIALYIDNYFMWITLFSFHFSLCQRVTYITARNPQSSIDMLDVFSATKKKGGWSSHPEVNPKS